MTGTSEPWLRPHEEWDLHIVDCVLPDLADVRGRTLADVDLRAKFGCSVVGIERQGFTIPLPAPDAVLYPRDRVLLLGTRAQVRAGRAFLATVSRAAAVESTFEEVQMRAVRVPEWSRALGQTLAQIAPAQAFGVQIAGVNRAGVRILNPGAEEKLQAGDEVLTLGTGDQLDEFRTWLRERPGEDVADSRADI